MEEPIQYRSKYQYQQKFKRCQITTNLRQDLRNQLKQLAITECFPETKVYDVCLNYFLNNESNKQMLIDMVRHYY